MDHETLKARIAALLKMTKTAGCSEAEATSAAAKAAELMREHGLTEAEVHSTTSKVMTRSRGNSARDRLWRHLAHCTNTVPVYDRNELLFVGHTPGPEIAAYLYAVMGRALDREIAAFKLTSNYRRRRSLTSRRQAVADFTNAMVFGLAEKLHALFKPSISTDARHAAELVVKEMFPAVSVTRPRATKAGRNQVAQMAGLAAANDTNLSHGVGPTGHRLQISGGPEQ